MKNVALLAATLLFTAHSAAAQCVCDANNSNSVEINELVLGVSNSLEGCMNGGLTCSIDFADDNTQVGTPDCFYVGRWNQSCGADDLETRWISDLADDGTEEDIVIVDLVGFEPPLFYGAATTSPTSADLIGYFRTLDASDLVDAPGTLTLGNGGGTLTVVPNSSPFMIEGCPFVRYEGALTDVVQPSAQPAAASVRVSPAAYERLRGARAKRPPRQNFQRK
jgi:hypothetical protein